MANVTIYPTRVRTAETLWDYEANVLTDDSAYAIRRPGTGNGYRLWLDTFSAGLPQDITLQGITIRPKASTSASVLDAYITAAIAYDGKTVASLVYPSSALTTTSTQYWLGGSSNLWGLSGRYVKRPFIHGRPLWSVGIGVSGNVTGFDYRLQYVDVLLTYTLNTRLRGERSIFPVSLSAWPYISPADSITKKFNGTAPKHQVKSEDVNLLGDTLYSIQTTVANSTGYVRLVGLPPTSFVSTKAQSMISMMVTGTWAGGASYIQHQARYKQTQAGVVLTSTVTSSLTNRRQTTMPWLPVGMSSISYFTNIQAWVVVAGGGCVPLMAVAEPMTLIGANNPRTCFLEFGFTLMTPDGATITYPTGPDSGYGINKGATVTNANIPAGTVYVKLLGMSSGTRPQ